MMKPFKAWHRSMVFVGCMVALTSVGDSWGAAAVAAQGIQPVDDAALLRADPNEWLTYGRDYAESRYSPLNEIHSGNVDRLSLAWSWELDYAHEGRLESTPLVRDGIMYATGTWSVVFALDARTGERKWQWDPGIVRGGRDEGGPTHCCGPVNRGLAIYGDRVYVGLLDGRLVALDAETGGVVWSRQTTPLGKEYSITGAPRVVNGNVIIGNGGAEYHDVRGYVTAYDAETGDQVWRFYTVPGNPEEGFESAAMEYAAQTWAGEWWIGGGGGTVWDHMAYDPDTNLLFIGVGNGAPWSREHRSDGWGDNLFLASIVALDADTGELVWYYQTTPGDDWDYTATQHILLADIEIEGVERQVLMQAPKNGFFYVLNRVSGELLSADAFVHMTWATGVDMETGRPIETAEARYDVAGSWIAPGPRGGHNWKPMSWNPETGLVYVPAQNSQILHQRNPDYVPQPGRFSTGTSIDPGVELPRTVERPEPVSPAGFLMAWDPVQREEIWRVEHETGYNGGTLSTAGNLVFSATLQGVFGAYEAATGEALWQYELPPGPATPITYDLAGRQYLTILSGMGGEDGPPGRVWTFALDGGAE